MAFQQALRLASPVNSFFIGNEVLIEYLDGQDVDSKLVVYPAGHAKNTESNLKDLLEHKFSVFGEMGVIKYDLPK